MTAAARTSSGSFAGQTVWITGASSGIGEALAIAFAREGARLVLSSRRLSELQRVQQACERPADHAVVALDLADAPSLPGVAKDVFQRFGPVDVLVNNGGVSQRSLVIDAAPEIERQIMEIDYFAPVALTKAVLPSMLERGRGQVVVVSSVMGYVGTPGRSSYAAAKHALHGYFDSLRAEVWRAGISVTLACPGYVKTAVSANALGPRGEQRTRTESTHQRGISPERCAAAIIRAVARRKREVYVGGWEVAGIYVQRFAPALFASIVRRVKFSVDVSRAS